ILYEMLTGKVPWSGDSAQQVMHAKLEEDPTPPRALRPEIPPALEEVVLHALERRPERRPESALELREALAHLDSVVITNRAARCGKLTAQAAARREARRRGWGPALPAGSMPAWLPRYEARR